MQCRDERTCKIWSVNVSTLVWTVIHCRFLHAVTFFKSPHVDSQLDYSLNQVNDTIVDRWTCAICLSRRNVTFTSFLSTLRNISAHCRTFYSLCRGQAGMFLFAHFIFQTAVRKNTDPWILIPPRKKKGVFAWMCSRNWHVGGRDKEKCAWVWLRACVCDKWDYINCFSSVTPHGNTFISSGCYGRVSCVKPGFEMETFLNKIKTVWRQEVHRNVQAHVLRYVSLCLLVGVLWEEFRCKVCRVWVFSHFFCWYYKKKKAKSDLRQSDRRIKYGSVWGLHTCGRRSGSQWRTHVGLVPACVLVKHSAVIPHSDEERVKTLRDVTQSAASAILIIAQINEGRELVSVQRLCDVTN